MLWAASDAGFAVFLLMCFALAAVGVLVASLLMSLEPTRVGGFLGARPVPFVGFRRLRELAGVFALLVGVGTALTVAGWFGFGLLWIAVAGWVVMEVGLAGLALAGVGWVAKAAKYPMRQGISPPLESRDGAPAWLLEARRRVLLPAVVAPVLLLVLWLDPDRWWLAAVPFALAAIVAMLAAVRVSAAHRLGGESRLDPR